MDNANAHLFLKSDDLPRVKNSVTGGEQCHIQAAEQRLANENQFDIMRNYMYKILDHLETLV